MATKHLLFISFSPFSALNISLLLLPLKMRFTIPCGGEEYIYWGVCILSSFYELIQLTTTFCIEIYKDLFFLDNEKIETDIVANSVFHTFIGKQIPLMC